MRPIKSLNSGFTLIELMVVVAIISIMAAIAYPSYTGHMKKVRRSAAAACLTERAQFMERFYTTNMKYNTDASGAAVSIPNSACTADLAEYYTFDNPPSNLTATTYTVTATPAGSQASDSCGNLSINQAGTKAVSGSGASVSKCF